MQCIYKDINSSCLRLSTKLVLCYIVLNENKSVFFLTYADQINSKEHVYEDFEPDKLISSPVNEDVRIFLVFVFL